VPAGPADLRHGSRPIAVERLPPAFNDGPTDGRAPHESGKAFLRATSATVALSVRRSRFAFSDQRNVTCLTRARAKGE
jgi:hypothetical protein